MDSATRRSGNALFLPDMCGVRPLFLVLLFAQLLAIILTLAESGGFRVRFEAFGFISLFTQLNALAIAAILCLARDHLAGLREPLAVALSYGLMLLTTVIVTESAWWMLLLDGRVSVIRSGHLEFLARTLGISTIVSALTLRYFFVQHHWRRQIEAESRARIQALQSRIRPHFFFNCMNTIASLTRTNPDQAEVAIEDMAELFRASLADASTLVRLDAEVQLAKRYLDIERLRLSSRLVVQWLTDELPVDARLPALTLQPLLENAIYYGIEPLLEGGLIAVVGKRSDGMLSITIRNPVGTRPTTRRGNRMAQSNVGERLRAHFGSRANLTIDRAPASYTVALVFPYVNTDADPDRR